MTPVGVRRALCLAVVLAFVVVSGTGCRYVRNRMVNAMGDALDFARADVSLSFGTDMGAHVRLTKFVQGESYSYEDLYRVGYNPRMPGIWKEDRDDWWVGPWHGKRIDVQNEYLCRVSAWQTQKMRSDYSVTGVNMETADEIGAGFHLFVFGFRVGFRPLEVADFLTSWFGLDLAGDDLSAHEREAMREARRAARAAEGKGKEKSPKPAAEKSAEAQPQRSEP